MTGVRVSDLSRCSGIVPGLVGWPFLDNKKAIRQHADLLFPRLYTIKHQSSANRTRPLVNKGFVGWNCRNVNTLEKISNRTPFTRLPPPVLVSNKVATEMQMQKHDRREIPVFFHWMLCWELSDFASYRVTMPLVFVSAPRVYISGMLVCSMLYWIW